MASAACLAEREPLNLSGAIRMRMRHFLVEKVDSSRNPVLFLQTIEQIFDKLRFGV
jgi:hypothetical protein